NNTSKPQITSANGITDSDHKIIHITWYNNIFISNRRNKNRKRTIFKYEDMNTDTWADFTNKVDKNLDLMEISNLNIENTQELNKQWHIFYNAIRKASTKHIPTTKIQPKTYHSFSTKATKLHQSLKRINKIV